jgi:hypothetical protein
MKKPKAKFRVGRYVCIRDDYLDAEKITAKVLAQDGVWEYRIGPHWWSEDSLCTPRKKTR